MCPVDSPHPPEQLFSAQISLLSEVLDFVARACVENGFKQNTTLRARLVVEELFTNTVHHGYRNNGGLVWLSTRHDAQRLLIGYQDAAPAYNPLAKNEAAIQAMHAHAEQRPVGGLGVVLIANLADSADYRYQNGRNILDLIFFDREQENSGN